MCQDSALSICRDAEEEKRGASVLRREWREGCAIAGNTDLLSVEWEVLKYFRHRVTSSLY